MTSARLTTAGVRATLRGDLVAGVTTAVMLVPQAMAYAMLAGLPPVVGLYASVVPLVAYALLGSSRQLAVGPVAMLSLLVLTGVGAFAEPGSERFIALATLLALLMGAVQVAMGLLRLGFLANFLSHPVVSGFTSAAALIIGLNQLGPLLGLDLPRGHDVLAILGAAARGLVALQPATAIIGALSVAGLVLLQRYLPKAPRALIVVVTATLAVVLFGLSGDGGVATVGVVPRGLPAPALPSLLDGETLFALLPLAVIVSFVAFMESVSVAKAVARRHGYEVAPSRELVALGAANVAAGLFSGYPVTGGFARTAVNDQAGAHTRLAGVVTALVVALSVLLFTPLFTDLPRSALAAIIMVAVFGLIDHREVRHLWRVKRGDLALLGVTFAGTLAIGVMPGILLGVGASLLWFIVRSTRPHFAVLGRLPGTSIYRNVKHYPEAETLPGLLVVRIDAQFYFGNVSFLKTTLRDLEAKSATPLRAVILDQSGVNHLDSSAATALLDLAEDYRRRGIRLHMANVKRPVEVVMERAGLKRLLGAEAFHLELDGAIAAVTLARHTTGP